MHKKAVSFFATMKNGTVFMLYCAFSLTAPRAYIFCEVAEGIIVFCYFIGFLVGIKVNYAIAIIRIGKGNPVAP